MANLDLIKITCPVCGGQEYTDLYTRMDGLKIVQCKSCSLAYLNPRPTDESIPLLYDSSYFVGGNPMIAQGYKYLDDELDNIRHPERKWKPILDKIAEYVRKDQVKLLDVGCAVGGFLHLAEKYYSWQGQGVEVSEYAAEYARSHYQLKVFNGFLKEAKFPDEEFDIVSLFDVIEHDPYPMKLLEEIHRILKPGGLIVLLTPNIKQAEKYGQDWEGLKISFEHLTYFSPTTLPSVLQKTGFETLFLRTQGWIQNIFQKNLSVKPNITAEETQDLPLSRKLFLRLKKTIPFLRPVWISFNQLINAPSLRKGYGYHLFVIAKSRKSHLPVQYSIMPSNK